MSARATTSGRSAGQSSAVAVRSGGGGVVSQATAHVVARAIPYLPPWVGAAALPPVFGAVTHAAWGGSPLSAGLACAALGTGGALLSAVTWMTSTVGSGVRRFRRAQATASVAAGMGWLTCATAAGPFTHFALDSWGLLGGMFAASWNIRQITAAGAGEATESEEKGGWGKLAQSIGLEKFTLERVKGNGKGVVTAQINVPAGKEVSDAQGAVGRLAAATHVPPSAVVITKDPDDAAVAHLKLRVADMLKDGVGFELPAALGLLPNEPLPVGLYADAEPVLINPFDATILQHLLVMGVTGAGKSELCRTVVSHLACRRQMSVILVDLAKGRQSVGHIADGVDWLIQDKKEAKRLLKSLPAAIKARGDRLGDEGLDQWAPKSSLNAVAVWMEEAADLASFEELDEIARKARSVGIWLIISLQRATWTNVSTDVRANLQAVACFGVNEAGDASFALPDSVTSAGAVPDWGNNRPGYGFATGMGIPQERWTTEWRGALTDRDTLAALVAAAAPFRDPLDDVTAEAFGLAYQQRTHRGTNRTSGFVPGPSAQAMAAAIEAAGIRQIEAGPDVEHQDDVDDETELTPEEMQEMDEEIREIADEILGGIPGDPEPDAPYAGLRLEDDVPDVDPDSGVEFEQPRPVSTEEARFLLCQELDRWAVGGRAEFSPADLIPVTVAAGRKRPWLQGELKKMVEAGILANDSHGEYTILHSPLQPA